MSIGFILPSVFPKWFTPAGDAVLSGGSLEFYDVGTTTPKSVYADYQRTVAIGAVVTLDSAGDATIFLGDGGYKVILKDESGAQLDLVDGIFTGGGYGILGSNASVGFFKLYADLRALTVGPDVAYVCGRTAEGDGGQGLFQLIPGSSTPDDDGVYLVAAGGTYVYKRIFDESINPEWFGVKYGIASDQSSRFNAAVAASVYLNFPVLVTAQVYLGANTTIPSNASLRNTEDGYFSSPSAVTMTFSSGSRFSGTGPAFRSAVQPIFVAGTIDALRLSWFGGTDSDKWARCLSSTTANSPLLMDVSTSLTSDLTIPANLAFEPVGGAVVTFGGFANLSIASLNYAGLAQFVAWTVDTYVGSVSIGSPVCYMEWFGGSPANDGIDNAIPFRACMKAQRLDLVANSVYTVASTNPLSYSNMGVAQFVGNSSTININQDLDITVVETNQITIGGSGTFNVGAAIFRNSTIIMALTGGAKSARNSLIFDVDTLVQSNDSTIFGGLTQLGGGMDNCSVTLSSTTYITSGHTFNGCKFIKSEAQHLPAFTATTNPATITFSGCSFSIDGPLLYSENANLVVDLVGCSAIGGFATALSNGYAKVNLKGCGVAKNSSAYSIDGVDLEVANTTKIGDSRVAQVITDTVTNWKGLGAPTSDGTTLTLGANAALSSDPYSQDTIRCVALGVFDAAWRYGGIFETEVTYPVGQSPDPDTELVVMFCHPPTANVVTVGVNAVGDGGYYSTNPVDLGKNLPVRLPILNGAKLKTRTNVWGGQIDLRAIPEPHSTYTVSDIWGDATTSVPTNTNSIIQEFGRLVIYNTGTGVLPAGTKIKVTYRYDLPNRDQFKKFFSDPDPRQYIGSDFYRSAPLAWQAIRVRTSLTASYSGQTQLAIPLMFRDCDKNGVQAVVSRREADGMQAIQWNGATLAVGWS